MFFLITLWKQKEKTGVLHTLYRFFSKNQSLKTLQREFVCLLSIFQVFYFIIHLVITVFFLCSIAYNLTFDNNFDALQYISTSTIADNPEKEYVNLYLSVAVFFIIIDNIVLYYIWKDVKEGKEYLKKLNSNINGGSIGNLSISTISYGKEIV